MPFEVGDEVRARFVNAEGQTYTVPPRVYRGVVARLNYGSERFPYEVLPGTKCAYDRKIRNGLVTQFTNISELHRENELTSWDSQHAD